MSHLPSFLNSGTQSIDGLMVLDGVISPRSPRRVSRTETVGRRTWPAQFHRPNTNPPPPPPRRVSRTTTIGRRTWPAQFQRPNPNPPSNPVREYHQMAAEAVVMTTPPPPRRVSRTVTIGRRTWPAQFHRPNPNPPSNPVQGYHQMAAEGVVMTTPPPFVLAIPAASPGSRYPEADLQRQRRPREELTTELHLEDETAVLMPRQRRLRLVLPFGERFHDETEAAVAASAEEYEMRTTGASESAIANLERVEIGWKGVDCCTICLDEMGSGEGKAIKLDCKHIFHESCLVSWLRTSNCCPLCRFQIQDS